MWLCHPRDYLLEGEDNELELLECCSEPLRRDHHTRFASKRGRVREAELLKEIWQISVMAKNKTVNRAKLHSLKQGKEEPDRVTAIVEREVSQTKYCIAS